MTVRQFIKENSFTLLLLGGVAIGGACGALIGSGVDVVRPVGDIFMNLVITLVVPLVFFSISSSICSLCAGGKAGKVMGWTLVVFLGMSLVIGLLSYFALVIFDPIGSSGSDLMDGLVSVDAAAGGASVGESITSAVSVSDFGQLFSRSRIIPLIIAALLTGLGAHASGEKGAAFRSLLESGSAVMMKIMGIIMYAAPVGLGCYFAVLLADLGSQVVGGYLRAFVIFCVLTIIVFFGLNPLIVLLAKGRKFVPVFWKHIVPPCITAMASASSTVAMPGNIQALKNMGIDGAVADSVIPFGTNVHKEGSVSLGIMKGAFMVLLMGQSIATPHMALVLFGISILTAVVVTAVPVGGLTTEILICMLLGVDPSMAGILIVISILLDIPATLLNSACNVSAAVLIDSLSTNSCSK